MRDFKTSSTRFCFREPWDGPFGEIPYIEIREDEDIPPLNRARAVHVHSFSRSEPATSTIAIAWVVSGTEVVLKYHCKANHPRLKKAYQAAPLFGVQVLNILCLDEQSGKRSEEFRYIETTETISKDDVPEPLRPFVTQVETWQAFFQKPAMKNLRFQFRGPVTSEGYYLAIIGRGALMLGKTPGSVSEEMNPYGFDFNPKTEPPTLMDDRVYWELTEPKILVILLHAWSNEQVVTYYSYLETFQNYKKTQAEYEQRMDVARRANEAEDAERRKQQTEATRQALLSL